MTAREILKKPGKRRPGMPAQEIGGNITSGAVGCPAKKQPIRLMCYNCEQIVHKPQQCPRCGIAITADDREVN